MNLFFFLLCFTLTSCYWHDSLADELRVRAKDGLVLAQLSNQGSPSRVIVDFAGQAKREPVKCCPWAAGKIVKGTTVVVVEARSPSEVNADALNGLIHGDKVARLDLKGQVLARSAVEVRSEDIALGPDLHRFAFIGTPAEPSMPFGLYLGAFDSAEVTKVTEFAESDRTIGFHSEGRHYSVDWFPNGESLVYSDGHHIHRVILKTLNDSVLAVGSSPQVSPDGGKIAFLTDKHQGAILNEAMGRTSLLLHGQELLRPPLWSPDGHYLLLTTHSISVFPCFSYGKVTVYRVSDGDTYRVPYCGISGSPLQWAQITP